MDTGFTDGSSGPLALCLSATSSALSHYAMKLNKLAQRQCSIDLCYTKENSAHQLQCRGCIEIEELLAWVRNSKATKTSYEGVLDSSRIHRSFAELENCASIHQCVACQVIRRAFLLAQITQTEVDELYATSDDTYIFARVHYTTKRTFLQVVIGSDALDLKTAWILCSEKPEQARTELAVAPLGFDEVFINLKPRVQDCRDNHHDCRDLKYSSTNPSWLVELRPNNTARLVRLRGSAFVHYVSLSYSWGIPDNHWEKKSFERTKRLTPDPQTAVHQPFHRSDLPQTLQDAMRITEAFGIRYIWIDRLCIPRGADWDAEASKMHEVFGNAYFTLAATGAERAWDTLDTGRQAWSYYPRTCKVGAYWLSTIDMGLNDMRVHAPLFKRGWVLQEERLSPRVLYWCGQRAYWSCATGDPYIEGSQGLCDNRASQDWSDPQSFLEYCYKGMMAKLEDEWLDIVASYARRELFRGEDRFTAISGLATRYLDAKRTVKNTDQKEEYLAGLWRGNIARGLSWSVTRGVNSPRLDGVAPSWSWASLPLCTEIKFGTEFNEAPTFALLKATFAKDDTEKHSIGKNDMDAIDKGASARELVLKGHCRHFLSYGAERVPWNRIRDSRGSEDHFDFSERPEQPAYARDPESGRVVTYEARRSPVVGQLDYANSTIHSLPEEKLTELLAFEIGRSSMLLLLVEQKDPDGTLCCTRIGVATNEYREDFFAGSEVKKIRLI